MSNISTHIDRMKQLNAMLVGGDLIDLAIVPPAIEMLAAIKNRVANQGKRTDGGDIGQYSTKPMYAQRNQFIKGGFNAQGKNNVNGLTIGDKLAPTVRTKSTGVKKNKTAYSKYTLVKPDYTERKTMYLEEGYKELRDIQGMRTDIMNLKYSGKLMNDYQQARIGDMVVLGITTERSAQIYNGQTYGTKKMSGRGPFFVANEQEKQEFLNRSQYIINRLSVGVLLKGDVTVAIN